MAGRIVLFGATGYTGKLTAEALVRRGVKPVLAGRSAEKLDALAAELGADLETGVADVGDPSSIAGLLGERDVLLTTVGPFTRWGASAAQASLDAGAHYIDSTGEPGFIRRVFEEYGPRAQRVGTGMLTALGNDWVPGNLAGALALEEAGERATRVDIGYFATGGGAGGGFSAGTRASTVASLSEPSFAWRGGRIVSERTARKVREFDIDGKELEALTVGGTEHFALPRLAPQLDEVNVYLGWFGKMTRAFHLGTAPMAAAFHVPGARRLWSAVTGRLVKGSAGGPDAEARAGSRSAFVAIAYDAAGEQLSEVRLDAPDGYTLTGDLLAWGADAASKNKLRGTGALGPVDGFGLTELLQGCEEAGIRQAQPNVTQPSPTVPV